MEMQLDQILDEIGMNRWSLKQNFTMMTITTMMTVMI